LCGGGKDDRARMCYRCRIEHYPARAGTGQGAYINSMGYVLVYAPNHIYADKDGFIQEHRLVVERDIRRVLWPHEHIHHINGDRKDNRRENLDIMTSSEHCKEHRPWEHIGKHGAGPCL
jgi:hypothetical protein